MKTTIVNRFNGSVLFETGADLRSADLSGANLMSADLSDADLSDANLRGADLRGADLRGANLMSADLRDADLSDANLSDANLRDANLSGANLMSADLSDADLRDANLRGADLSGANLMSADLRDADLSDANLMGADLSDININESTFGIAMNCPEDGSFVAYKKCKSDKIVKLLIPEDAKRSSATTYKCRADRAIVLEISDGSDCAISQYDDSFIYKVGQTVTVNNFDNNRWDECSTGIHFFMSKLMAEKY